MDVHDACLQMFRWKPPAAISRKRVNVGWCVVMELYHQIEWSISHRGFEDTELSQALNWSTDFRAFRLATQPVYSPALMVASEARAHNFFRRPICPRTTGVRTCFSPITGAATSSRPCSTCPALLHVISLARLACVHTWAWAALAMKSCCERTSCRLLDTPCRAMRASDPT